MARQFGWICLAFTLFAFSGETTEAQLYRPAARAVQTPLRFLGHGNGHGYHHCNPGPNVSYYNPWSHKNSFLISNSPQFMARYGHELHRTPMEILQFGNQTWGNQPLPGQPVAATMNADFVPATRTEEAKDDFDFETEDDYGGDFQPNSAAADDAKEVEDSFDKEADAMNEKSDATPESDQDNEAEDSVGGFESLKEAVESTTEAASLLMPNQFLPASHPTGK